jgi:hypothetical protein
MGGPRALSTNSQEFELVAVLTELLFGNEAAESVEQTLDRLVAPDFTQRVNGQVYQRPDYDAHVRAVRQRVTGGEVHVLEQITAGDSIAGRYLFRIVSADGREAQWECHLFARLRDGLVASMVEVSRQVEDSDNEDLLPV